MAIGVVKQAWKPIYVSQIKIGKSDSAAARYAGVSNLNVLSAQSRDQEFADQCKEAKENRPKLCNW